MGELSEKSAANVVTESFAANSRTCKNTTIVAGNRQQIAARNACHAAQVNKTELQMAEQFFGLLKKLQRRPLPCLAASVQALRGQAQASTVGHTAGTQRRPVRWCGWVGWRKRTKKKRLK